jgi:serine O-acetyltransferase
MIREVRADMSRYRNKGASWGQIFGNPAVWALSWYRFGHWLYKERSPGLLRPFGKVLYLFGYKFFEIVMEMHLDPSTEIGGGLYLGHSGAIHFNPEAVIGKNCDIAPHVTIGTSAMGRKGAPRVGNDVYVGTGATIIGKVSVGDGAKIAANTLVITNVPAGATVMGVPGRVVMKPVHAPSEKPLGSQQNEPVSEPARAVE